MSFEMSLPHPPRIQSLAADGTEALAHDEKQWQLYFTVQRALQQVRAGQGRDSGGQCGEGRALGARQGLHSTLLRRSECALQPAACPGGVARQSFQCIM
jgi:hypothetical protein